MALQKLLKIFSFKELKRKFPILQWLPRYKKSFLIQDFIAGVSVGLTAIPQGMANAAIAGLAVSCFVYTIFGSCKDITIGPTSLLALLIRSTVDNLNVDFAILITFLSGCIIFTLGLFNLGFLVQFISAPTITAFITAAALIIGSGQVRSLFGIKSTSSSEFINVWMNVFTHLNEIKWTDTLLGILSIILLFSIKSLSRFESWPKFGKFLSLARNALVVTIGIIIAYIFHLNGIAPFQLTGDVEEGLPPLQLPPFSTKVNEKVYEFSEMIKAVGSLLATIPLVAILEMIAIAKAFSKGKTVDASQELIALGMVNIASSFVSSVPITSSLTRSAVNNASGVKTTFGGIFTGILVMLALGFLTKTFYFIPKSVLSAVVISAMIAMIDINEIIKIYKTKRSDMIPFVVTFLTSLLFGLEFGIVSGISVNILFVIYNSSRPKITFEKEKINNHEVLIVTPYQNLFYCSADYFKSVFIKYLMTHDFEGELILIKGDSVDVIDSTSAKMFASIPTDVVLFDKKICFWNWKTETFNIMMRHNPKLFVYFKSAKTLKDLIEENYEV
ncbi:CLUMA_CG016206, isoform A [Clunio marinus]|uniref:CLUMA_CG016206, isoform A n=1 Tax=Clunio marinus TaxID=568069 RepID=A0A1J1IUE7_9DIPT|nr:CLUMA_CG016206, isoform A [Clunio marinus]